MSKLIESQNFYQLLEVLPGATQSEIHKAYQKAKETYSNGNPALYSVFTREEAVELLKLIEEAYKVLSNHESRQRYDYMLKNPNAPELTDQPQESSFQERRTLPPGHAKTKFGTYKINSVLDDEIKFCEEFSGQMFRNVREYKNISLEALCESTRISKSYLTAIEEEQYNQLPAPVFSRGFIVQFAKVLGFNEKVIASSFMKKYNEAVG